MAKPRRKLRPSARIPEDLPPAYAPRNGRITAATLSAIKEEKSLATFIPLFKKKMARLDQQGAATGQTQLITAGDFLTRDDDVGQPDQIEIGGYDVQQLAIQTPTIYPVTGPIFDPPTGGYAIGATAGRPFTITTGAATTVDTGYNNNLTEVYTVALRQALATRAQRTILVGTTTAGTASTINLTNNNFTGTSVTYNNDWLYTGEDAWGIVDYACKKHRCKNDEWGGGWSKRQDKWEDLTKAANYVAKLTNEQRAWRQWNNVLSTAKETRAQLEARQRREAQDQHEREERVRVERVLYEQRRDRAEKLLKFVLSQEQRGDYERNGFFFVRAPSGNRYRINKNGQHGNVYLVDDNGQELVSYCIQPREGLPDADAHVTQKLMLETAEAEFLRIANATFIRQRRAA